MRKIPKSVFAAVAATTLLLGSGMALAGGGAADAQAEPDVPDGPRAPGLDQQEAMLAALEADEALGLEAVPDLTAFYTKHVSPMDFGLPFGTAGMSWAGFCAYDQGGNLFNAGIELPVGAEITSISAHMDDLDSASNMSVQLWRVTQSGNGAEVTDALATASSTGSGGNQEVSAAVPGPEVVEANEFFHLLVTGSDSNERVCGVEVFYRIPSDHADLVFTPVEPCRIYDSRTSQGGPGAFSANQTRTFNIIGSGNFSSQGGSATGCALPGITGNCFISCSKVTKAVAVNLVSISPSSAGQAQMWDPSDAPPSGALVNYIPGGNNSNATIVGISQCTGFLPSSCPADISVRNVSTGTANLALVVTGYYTYADYSG